MARRAAKHGAPRRAVPGPEVAQHDPELDSYLAALAPDAGATDSLGQALQVRLPGIQIEELRRIAEEHDTSAAAVAARWIGERLAGEDPPTGPLRIV